MPGEEKLNDLRDHPKLPHRVYFFVGVSHLDGARGITSPPFHIRFFKESNTPMGH